MTEEQLLEFVDAWRRCGDLDETMAESQNHVFEAFDPELLFADKRVVGVALIAVPSRSGAPLGEGFAESFAASDRGRLRAGSSRVGAMSPGRVVSPGSPLPDR
ncbi:MAG: hypothetical protein ACRD0U_00430 [Acidimicrobiales bacterium]